MLQHDMPTRRTSCGVCGAAPLPVLLCKLCAETCACAVQDEQDHQNVWDSVSIACQHGAARLAVVQSTDLLPDLASAALGREVLPCNRAPALHALANVAGAERLGPESQPEDALLPNTEVLHACLLCM